MLVRVAQRRGHLARDPERFLHPELLFSAQPATQRLARDVWHGVKRSCRTAAVFGGAGVEQGKNVGVLQAGCDADLAQEAVGPQTAGELRVEHLERDEAIMTQVACEVHRRHPASAQFPLHPVAVAERGVGCRKLRTPTGPRRG